MFIDPCINGCTDGTGTGDASCNPFDWCGDGTCKGDETCGGCPADCGECPPTGFCVGKTDGQYCKSGEIYICDSQELVFIDPCVNGCSDGTGSGDATCGPGQPGSFCTQKADGAWCDGADVAVSCVDGAIGASTWCDNGCQQGAPGEAKCKSPDQPPPPPEGFCGSRADGYWCDFESGALVLCADGVIAGGGPCPQGTVCESRPPGEDDVCEPFGETPPSFCATKGNMAHCLNATKLIHCFSGAVAMIEPCAGGCKDNGPSTADECAVGQVDPAFCVGKVSYYCADAATLVYCAAGAVGATYPCPMGCLSQAEGTQDTCAPEDAAAFCAAHPGANELWCNGPEQLVHCDGGALVSSTDCPGPCTKGAPGMPDGCGSAAGCQADFAAFPVSVIHDEDCCPRLSGATLLDVPSLDQTQHSEKLGDCEGLTIKSHGCLITAFSMLYGYYGKNRTLGGVEVANTPPNENEWRTDNSGYADCGADDNGKSVGACCAYWNTHPSGVPYLNPAYNVPGSGCLLDDATAQTIATNLNDGKPVLAWVQSSKTSQHWLVIDGVDPTGALLVNDPWKGGKGKALGAASGLGPYTSIVQLLAPTVIGIGGRDLPEAPPQEDQGVDPSGHGPLGITVYTEEGKAALEDDPSVYVRSDSGCAASPGAPGSTGVLLLALLLLLSLTRRVRTGTKRSDHHHGGKMEVVKNAHFDPLASRAATR